MLMVYYHNTGQLTSAVAVTTAVGYCFTSRSGHADRAARRPELPAARIACGRRMHRRPSAAEQSSFPAAMRRQD